MLQANSKLIESFCSYVLQVIEVDLHYCYMDYAQVMRGKIIA